MLAQPEELAHQGLVLLWDGGADQALPMASIGYVKGMARVCSLLALLLHVMMDLKTSKEDFAAWHPLLYSSCLRVYGHYSPKESKMEESLKAMQLSAAGSIRRPYNVIQVAGTLHNLGKHGVMNLTRFVKMHNSRNPKMHQMLGQTAVALKLLHEGLPQDCAWMSRFIDLINLIQCDG